MNGLLGDPDGLGDLAPRPTGRASIVDMEDFEGFQEAAQGGHSSKTLPRICRVAGRLDKFLNGHHGCQHKLTRKGRQHMLTASGQEP